MFERWKSSGFTLIEVVVVLTILAILAAFAVPRFATLEEEARVAATEALAGIIRSNAALSHALWLAQGQPPSVMLDGTELVMINGYPDRHTVGGTLADLSGFDYDVNTGVFSKTGAPGDCTVAYSEASAPGMSPKVVVAVGGC